MIFLLGKDSRESNFLSFPLIIFIGFQKIFGESTCCIFFFQSKAWIGRIFPCFLLPRRVSNDCLLSAFVSPLFRKKSNDFFKKRTWLFPKKDMTVLVFPPKKKPPKQFFHSDFFGAQSFGIKGIFFSSRKIEQFSSAQKPWVWILIDFFQKISIWIECPPFVQYNQMKKNTFMQPFFDRQYLWGCMPYYCQQCQVHGRCFPSAINWCWIRWPSVIRANFPKR